MSSLITLEKIRPDGYAYPVGLNAKPLTVDYQKFEGKYILFRSQIELVRKNNWLATANLSEE